MFAYAIGPPLVALGPLCSAAGAGGGTEAGRWTALYLPDVAEHVGLAGVGESARDASGMATPRSLAGLRVCARQRAEGCGARAAVHSREYLLAHVAHSTAAAAAALGRDTDALSLLKYARETGAAARGPGGGVAADGALGSSRVGGSGTGLKRLGKRLTGVAVHASTDCNEARQLHGSWVAGWDGCGGACCLGKLVEEGTALLEYKARDAGWAAALGPVSAGAGTTSLLATSRPSRPSSALTVSSAVDNGMHSTASTRPSSALSRPSRPPSRKSRPREKLGSDSAPSPLAACTRRPRPATPPPPPRLPHASTMASLAFD